MKFLLLAALASLTFMLPASAAFDVFIKFEQPSSSALAVTGDSLDTQYPGTSGWFIASSFQFGVANSIMIGGTSGGGGAGKAAFENFVISKRTGAASAAFFQTCATGGRYGKATIVVRRAGGSTGTSVRVLQASLYFVMVQSITNSGSDGDENVTEDVTFQYGAHEIQFYTINPKTGIEEAAGPAAIWSQVTNSATTDT